MNRRTSIKSILTLSILSVSSFSVYKWIDLHQKLDYKSLISFKDLIIELADTIIPTTDTPGAKDANVQEYIINVIVNCTGKVEQNKFLNGLKSVNDYCSENFSKSFEKCNLDEKTSVLNYFEQQESYPYPILNKINNKFLGKSFYTQLKILTVSGYCCSQIGATKGLAYDYIPGTFKSCIPLKFGQKSWATK